MMLSKVAERIYWAARYLERIESTARLLMIYDNLLFDLPKCVRLSWYHLVTINSLEEIFAGERNERDVVAFMLGDQSNPGSVVSSLHMLRENVRATRDVVLCDTWELVNELHLYVQQDLQQGQMRHYRREFLDGIIKGCQQIQGLLYGNMPQDEAWHILQLGRHLERADMTTRNLDAGIAAILETHADHHAINAQQIIMGNVLRSLNADQAYHRLTHNVAGTEPVIAFLLEDPALPRSVGHSITIMSRSCSRLPRGEALVDELTMLAKLLAEGAVKRTANQACRNYLNQLQLRLSILHLAIRETWFPKV